MHSHIPIRLKLVLLSQAHACAGTRAGSKILFQSLDLAIAKPQVEPL